MNEELVLCRRQRAVETILDARVLLECGSLFSAVNRIYYALFYEVLALLTVKGLSSRKHSGIKAMFNSEYIKSGVLSVEVGRFYSQMFEFRQKSDYEDYAKFEQSKVVDWLNQAELSIVAMEKLFNV